MRRANKSITEDRLITLTTNDSGEFVTLDDIPATRVSLVMFIDNQNAAWGWDSEIVDVPVDSVVMLGTITFEREN